MGLSWSDCHPGVILIVSYPIVILAYVIANRSVCGSDHDVSGCDPDIEKSGNLLEYCAENEESPKLLYSRMTVENNIATNVISHNSLAFVYS